MSIYKTRRALYNTASWLGLWSAITRGPDAVIRFFVRRIIFRALSRVW